MKVEFFLDKTGAVKRELYFKMGENGEWLKYDLLTDIQIESIFDLMKSHPNAFEALMKLSHFISGRRDILKQFILCNWTSMDRHWDISDNQFRFETVDCPFKSSSNCPYNGIGQVCIKHQTN